jgi:leucyl-tRNA synthetase
MEQSSVQQDFSGSDRAFARATFMDFDYERVWQERWRAAGLFEPSPDGSRPKWFIVELPPFANGQLHLGHLRNYTMGDVVARYRRMAGYDVLYLAGADAFGLPNENAARDEGCSPADLVRRNIDSMLGQFARLGFSHDPRFFLADHEPAYYRWVQYVFCKLFEAGYAYRAKGPTNWCPSCQTTLSDSLVEKGRCWRCGTEVRVADLDRWFVREIEFAQAVLDEKDSLPGWPEVVKKIHLDWIGRQDGYAITVAVAGRAETMEVFVLDPSELADAQFLAIGPHHALGKALAGGGAALGEVRAPWSGSVLPLVLLEDDERVRDQDVLLGRPMRNARDRAVWDALGLQPRSATAGSAISIETLIEDGMAKKAVRFRLRDWDFARPRYWGTPLPIMHCPDCGIVAVPERDLPVLLPEGVDLEADGNPLATCERFVETACPACGGPARRDTDTIETYASPWWYYLLCGGPGGENPFASAGAARWMPVDLMIGGLDQSRTCFFHLRTMAQALRRLGIADEPHPVRRLLAVGMIKVEGRKMSKSAGNAVTLPQLVERYGADALRIAVLSAAAPDQDVNWNEDIVRRASKFLRSVAEFFGRRAFAFADLDDVAEPANKLQRKLLRQLEAAQRRITGSMQRYAFHVCLDDLRALFDSMQKFERESRAHPAETDHNALARVGRAFLSMLSPFAPHLVEELWSRARGQGFAAAFPWPRNDTEQQPSASMETRS